MMKRYPIRVVKYFLFLALLFIVLFGLMIATGYSSWQTFQAVWSSDRSWVLILVFVVLPLAYPLFSYSAREVRGNLHEGRRVVERALESCGYHIAENHPEEIIARARGFKKAALLFEDRITLTTEGNHYLRIDGPKKEIVKLESRIRSFSAL